MSAPPTIPSGLAVSAARTADRAGWRTVVKVTAFILAWPAIAFAWSSDDLTTRMLMIGTVLLVVGVWGTKPAGMPFWHWARVLVGRIALGLGVLVLALGALVEWGVPAVADRVQDVVDRQTDRVVEQVTPDPPSWLERWTR